MKRNLIGTLALAVVSILFNATGACAQSIVRSDVPFKFMVGQKQMPAGRYAISAQGLAAVAITNLNTSVSALSVTGPALPNSGSPRLVFHGVGGQYFLSEVWGAEGQTGAIVPRSALEKELRMASTASIGQIVIALK